MRKNKNPGTVDYVEVELEEPSGLDHTFRISTTGDTREPWQLTGVVLNGHLVTGQQCWTHFKSCASLVRVLHEVRKGKVELTMDQSTGELIITTKG